MTPLERRVAAAQATLDRYLGKPFQWWGADCARMAAFNLRQLGVRAPLAKFGRYSTALGAARQLKARGFSDVGEVLDDLGLPRIAPASALAADILALEGDGMGMALTVSMGNGRVLGWHAEAEGAVVMQPAAVLAAWSVL